MQFAGVSRTALNYKAMEGSAEDVDLMRVLDEIYMKGPCQGSRRLVMLLRRDHGVSINRKRVQRLR